MSTIAIPKTKAEQAFAVHFAAAEKRLPALLDQDDRGPRGAAFDDFIKRGLPHRREERWRYTDLRRLITDVPAPSIAPDQSFSRAEFADLLGAFGEFPAHRIVFVNGFHRADLSDYAVSVSDRSGLVIDLISAVPPTKKADVSRLMDPSSSAESDDGHDGVRDLNTALATDGVRIATVGKASVGKPILIVHVVAGPTAKLVTTRHSVSAGAGELTLIELHLTARSAAAGWLVNTATGVQATDGATVGHVKIVLGAEKSTHLGRVDTALAKDSTYLSSHLVMGGLIRNDLFVDFLGENAKVDISGLMLGRGRDHLDTTMVIDHRTGSCESREHFKTVLDDTARAVFQGKAIVRPHAQKTDGKQMAQALMLSPDAEFDSKPELEIYADDVVCGHGSTCAEIDDDMLFYLMARGIPQPEARAMLIESFAGEILDKVGHEGLRGILMDVTRRWLRAGTNTSGGTGA